MIRTRNQSRRGAYVPEAAMVIVVFFMFLFAIFEYGRFIYCTQVAENAAREGARMAIAHTNDKVTADVKQRVTERLAGIDKQLSNLQIDVSGIILVPKDTSEVAGTLLADWTEASTTDGISVQVSGDYRPILPTFLKLPATIPLRTRSVMYSEGN
ncbi:MAG: TadE/TadG family type IV pilus assembly protein [Gemmataceae bacterium]